MIVTGGNLHALSHAGDAVNGKGDAVQRVEIQFDGINDDGYPISDLVFGPNDYPYGMNDVVTLAGKLHAWLPDDSSKSLTSASLTQESKENVYAGNIKFSDTSGTFKRATLITLIPYYDQGVAGTEGKALGIPGENKLVIITQPVPN